ncbi:MAG TPA: hypothetical protein VE591_02585, partial [Candidatus Acidoferrum sp.]|nr:hypothetical protein [Candidatus Acidoferrum sp.]
MTAPHERRYDRPVDVFPYRAPRWIAAGLGLLLACIATALAPSPAQAATSSLDVGDQAIVRVFVKGRDNEVAIRTWDRSTVQVDSTDPDAPAIERKTINAGTPAFPLTAAIGPFPWIQHSEGQIVAQGTFPPEDFPYALFRPGNHDSIRVLAEEGSHLVVTVPANTGILWVQVGGGLTKIDGYHGSNLFLVQSSGRVKLDRVTTTAFAQMGFGTLHVVDSAFDRIRIRDNAAQLIFERVRSKQIEASTITGSIVYDAGTFDPGLARFESQNGNIALGLSGPAQVSGRSGDAHVYTQFDQRVAVAQPSDAQATANIGNGGALVNAISTH